MRFGLVALAINPASATWLVPAVFLQKQHKAIGGPPMAFFFGATMIQPSFNEFSRLAKQGNLIPIYQELLMDLETPLSFFK